MPITIASIIFIVFFVTTVVALMINDYKNSEAQFLGLAFVLLAVGAVVVCITESVPTNEPSTEKAKYYCIVDNKPYRFDNYYKVDIVNDNKQESTLYCIKGYYYTIKEWLVTYKYCDKELVISVPEGKGLKITDLTLEDSVRIINPENVCH